MINKIAILDLTKAISTSYHNELKGYNSWITVVDEEDREKVKRLKRNFLKTQSNFKFFSQFFYDWSDEDSDAYIQKDIETLGPQKRHVQNIITFIKEELVCSPKVYNLGINCFAGVSRSTAIGIIAWILSGKTIEESFQNILMWFIQATSSV